MKLSELNRHLLKDMIRDEHIGGSSLFNARDSIEELCSDSTRIYSKLGLPSSKKHLNKDVIEAILISTIFSDTTKVFSNSSFGTYQKTEEYIKEEIDELLSYYGIIDKEKPIQHISAGTITFTEEEAEFLYSNLLPLFEAERLTLSTRSNLLIVAGTKDEPNFYAVPAERDKISHNWRAPLYGKSQTSIPISYFGKNEEQNKIAHDILIPYVSGLEIKDFVQILDDENDLLSSFRKELKNITLLKPGEVKNSSEIYQDTIRPRVDKITQKFKSISEIHKLKVRGTFLATASLSLLSLTIGDYLAATSTMLSVGAGSAGLVKFESEYQAEVLNLKNDPLYLLWQLNKLRK